MELSILPTLPTSVAELKAQALASELDGPTLFDLRKDGKAPLFVSVLMHGNEVSGWDAVRLLGPQLADASVLVFVGNVEAACAGRRTLPGGIDFNRVWEGGDTPEAAVADAVVDFAAAATPYLAIDIHNNTGVNPPYAVVCRADRATLAAARAFSAQALFATQPHGFQTRRFARFCTALTVEVGTPDDPASIDRATAFLTWALAGAVPKDDATELALFETTARVKLVGDVVIEPETQRFNFRTAPASTALTRTGTVRAHTADGRDASDDYFSRSNGATVLKRPACIAMYTSDLDNARQDCLCYLLEPLSIHA